MTDVVKNIRSLVRPFIAFSFVTGTIALYLAGKIDPQSILQITGIIIGFYFGERAVGRSGVPSSGKIV